MSLVKLGSPWPLPLTWLLGCPVCAGALFGAGHGSCLIHVRCVCGMLSLTQAYTDYTCSSTAQTSLANSACYAGKTSMDRRLSWRAIPCSVYGRHVCAIPAELMPCAPPPPPPANPCVPPTSSTFFCNATTNMCYSYITAAASHSTAVSRCRAQGGELWFPRSAAEAGEVEATFGLTNSNGAIWLGLKRTDTYSWYSVDGSYWVPEFPTTGSSYGTWAHWGSDHFNGALDTNLQMNCVAAQTWSLHYAGYTCDPYSSVQRADDNCYQKAASFGSARHMAWRALGCSAAVPYVCNTPASAFQCPPPPQPGAPPPPPVCESLPPAGFPVGWPSGLFASCLAVLRSCCCMWC